MLQLLADNMYLPRPHEKQFDWLAFKATFPAAHVLHEVVSSVALSQYVPGEQGLQLLADDAYIPVPHVVQDDCPEVRVTLPMSQTLHVDAE